MTKIWVLLVLAYPYGGGSPAMTSAEFHSKKACDDAGKDAAEKLSITMIMTTRYTCNAKGE